MGSGTKVQLSTGLIEGFSAGDLLQYRGVPYAKPPVGRLRFVEPQPLDGWTGVVDARRNGPIARQAASRAFAVMGSIDQPQDEDCLSANLWVPDGAGEALPVVIWLHGGGFSSGAASLPWYDGGRIAKEQGVIVVGLNYRLGAFGYTSIPGVVPGNLGLLDLLAGIRWVGKEIAAFGGDPESITLMGQSAGGHAIASLLVTPDAKGLFHRAILQSPPLSIDAVSPNRAAATAAAFLESLGLSPVDEDLLGSLQRIPADQILEAQEAVAKKLSGISRGDLRPPFLPVDGDRPYQLEGRSLALVAGRNAAAWGVDLLVGWNRDEANLFLNQVPPVVAMTDQELESSLAMLASPAEVSAYLPPAEQGIAPGRRFIAFIGRQVFAGPAAKMAEVAAAAGGKAYAYQFDWSSPLPGLGASHCLELPFTFGNTGAWESADMLKGASPAEIERLTMEMMSRWGAFIRAGDPGFEPWTEANRVIHHFDVQSDVHAP